MVPITQENQGPSLMEMEFPRKKKQLQNLSHLLSRKANIKSMLHSKSHLKNINVVSNISQSGFHESLNSKLDINLVKQKIKQNLALAQLISHQKQAAKPTQQQQFQQQQSSISLQQTPPKLSKSQQKIKDFLLKKHYNGQKLQQIDDHFLKDICTLQQYHNSERDYTRTIQSNPIPSRHTRLIIQSSQQQYISRGLTPMKWQAVGKQSSCFIAKQE